MQQTIAILGAGGKLGREVVAASLSRGLAVRALVRRAVPTLAGETAVVGDARDASAIETLVRGATAVLSLVGPGPDSPSDLSTGFTRVLLDAMRREHVARLVYVSGVMIGHPIDRRGLMYRLIPALMPATARAQTADRAAAEHVVMTSDLDWTIVRPSRLTLGAPRGGIAYGERVRIGSLAAIRRADLAVFLLDAITRADLSHRAIAVLGR